MDDFYNEDFLFRKKNIGHAKPLDDNCLTHETGLTADETNELASLLGEKNEKKKEEEKSEPDPGSKSRSATILRRLADLLDSIEG